MQKGIVLHELGHPLGFGYEFVRPDRDYYVAIDFNNVDPSMAFNFYLDTSLNGYVWRHDLWLASICDCGTICDHIMLQFVTAARFVTT